MLSKGTAAPDFEFITPEGGRSTLRAHLTAGPVVLYFYPADFTPVCTAEACMYRDFEEELAVRGVRIIGVSPQDEASHTRFREKFRLPFPLVADPDRRVIRAYGATWPLGIGVRRISYLIGADGLVIDGVVADFGVERHMDFVQRVLRQFGEPIDASETGRGPT